MTANPHVLTNLLLVIYTTVCSYQSLKENYVHSAELPFNKLWNFVKLLANYRLCSRTFFSLKKLRRKITLCSSELALDTLWNFTRTSWKSRGNKERNSCISLVLVLHNTVRQQVAYGLSIRHESFTSGKNEKPYFLCYHLISLRIFFFGRKFMLRPIR